MGNIFSSNANTDANKKKTAPTEAATSAVLPPVLEVLQGRVVVKFSGIGSPTMAIQTIGRLTRGNINSAYAFTESEIGGGFSGTVRQAASKITGIKVAIKTFEKNVAANRSKVNLLRNEAQVYLKIDFAHIARLLEVWESSSAVHFVMEYCSGGDLVDYLASYHGRGSVGGAAPLGGRGLPEPIVRGIMHQIVMTVQYLHKRNIVHRDLKLEHFMLSGETHPNGACPYVKLIDLGLARPWTADVSRPMKSTCGSLPYVAPETLAGTYTNKCDIWPLGVIAYTLLTGSPPFFGTEEEIFIQIFSKPITGPPNASHDMKQFVQSTLTRMPADRPTASDLCTHPWFNDIRPLAFSPALASRVCDSIVRQANCSYFRRVVTTLLSYGLSDSDEGVIGCRNAYLALLGNGASGELSISDLVEFLEKYGMPSHMAEQTMTKFNFCHKSEVSYNDFLAGCLGSLIPIRSIWIRSTFWKFDKSRSGLVTTESLREMLGAIFKDNKLESMLREADRDGDKYIDYDEFQYIVAEMPAAM